MCLVYVVNSLGFVVYYASHALKWLIERHCSMDTEQLGERRDNGGVDRGGGQDRVWTLGRYFVK